MLGKYTYESPLHVTPIVSTTCSVMTKLLFSLSQKGKAAQYTENLSKSTQKQRQDVSILNSQYRMRLGPQRRGHNHVKTAQAANDTREAEVNLC